MKHLISKLELYLFFSYVPNFSEANLDWLHCDFHSDFGQGIDDELWWLSEGVKTLKQVMTREIMSTDPKADHIVLLSGGMDSRAILGGLLENLPKSKIIAATYGIPGSWDFESAKTIAGKFGMKHEVINLLDEKWDLDELVKAATRLKSPVSVYQSYVRQKINNRFGTDCIYWSGFLGDTVGGYSLRKVPSKDRLEAIKRHLTIEPTPNYRDESFNTAIVHKILDEFPWDRLSQSGLSLDQQLNYALRQRQLLQPTIIVNGFNFKTPFLHRDWVNFMLHAPCRLLLDQYLYKRILKESYRELANFPSETGAGMPFHASKYQIYVGKAIAKIKPHLVRTDPYSSHPRTNYINWTESLRHAGPFQDTVIATLQELKKRAIFDHEELDAWWSDHLSRKMDNTKLLLNLSSLELLLRSGVLSDETNGMDPNALHMSQIRKHEVRES